MTKGEKKYPNAKFISIYVDCDNEYVMETVGSRSIRTLFRDGDLSGSQYAYSPATVCALPDVSCLLQEVTYTLLEAGQKPVNPPIIATNNVVRGDVSLLPAAINWVDEADDERMGAALRPLIQDTKGIPLGMEMKAEALALIKEAFPT